jgi:hypothetical protein
VEGFGKTDFDDTMNGTTAVSVGEWEGVKVRGHSCFLDCDYPGDCGTRGDISKDPRYSEDWMRQQEFGEFGE